MSDSLDGGSQHNVSQFSQVGGPKRHMLSKGQESAGNINDLRMRKIRTNRAGRSDFNDGDFEKMFGKDIDQYLEGSEFDLDEYDRMSQFSHGTGRNSMANAKLKTMENVYLQRIETQAAEAISAKNRSAIRTHGNSTTTHSKPTTKKQKLTPR